MSGILQVPWNPAYATHFMLSGSPSLYSDFSFIEDKALLKKKKWPFFHFLYAQNTEDLMTFSKIVTVHPFFICVLHFIYIVHTLQILPCVNNLLLWCYHSWCMLRNMITAVFYCYMEKNWVKDRLGREDRWASFSSLNLCTLFLVWSYYQIIKFSKYSRFCLIIL